MKEFLIKLGKLFDLEFTSCENGALQLDGGLDGLVVFVSFYRSSIGKDSFRFEVSLPGGRMYDLASMPVADVDDSWREEVIKFLRNAKQNPELAEAQFWGLDWSRK